MAEYRIPAVNFYGLSDKIAKMNKRAAKLGVTPISLNVLRWEAQTVKDELTAMETIERFAVVDILGEAPKMAGWTFQAKVEPHNGYNLVKLMPGVVDVPKAYYAADMGCDHCGMDRRRNEVFVVKHDDGRYAQVGRTCLADFLGGQSPEILAARAEWMLALDSAMREAGDYGSRGFDYVNVEEFVALCSAFGRYEGFVTRRMIDEGKAFGPTTAAQAWRIVGERDGKFLRKIEENGFAVEARDVAIAQSALSWARNDAAADGNYMMNLVAACRAEAIDYRAAGIVASVIPAYRRHLESTIDVPDTEAQPVAAPAPVSQWIGNQGDKVSRDVTVQALIEMPPTQWGSSTLVKMIDAQGNVLIWFASNCPDLEPGDGVKVTGTIKQNNIRDGVKQTILTRCRMA